MRLSARNVFKGTVVKIVPGAVNCEVTVHVADGVEMVSIVSKEAVHALGLQIGSSSYVVIKASSVILGTD